MHPAQTGIPKSQGTQGSLVLIREYLANRPTQCHHQLLVVVDVKKAFDARPHAPISDTACKLSVQDKYLNFVKAFLSGRKYLIKTGRHRGSAEKTNEIGLPKEAVLSPMLFNLEMAPFLWWLAVVPHLALTVYADDITAWTMGSDNGPHHKKTI